LSLFNISRIDDCLPLPENGFYVDLMIESVFPEQLPEPAVEGVEAGHRFGIHEDTLAADCLDTGRLGLFYGIGEIGALLKPDSFDTAFRQLIDDRFGLIRFHAYKGGFRFDRKRSGIAISLIALDGIGCRMDGDKVVIVFAEGFINSIAEFFAAR